VNWCRLKPEKYKKKDPKITSLFFLVILVLPVKNNPKGKTSKKKRSKWREIKSFSFFHITCLLLFFLSYFLWFCQKQRILFSFGDFPNRNSETMETKKKDFILFFFSLLFPLFCPCFSIQAPALFF
jgi:hypothetical protein